MTVVIPEGYGQFTLIYTGPMFVSGGGATVLGFGAGEAPLFTLPEFASLIVEAWNNNLRALSDESLRLERVHWAGPTTSGDSPANLVGSRATTNASPNVSTLVSYTTDRKGRRGRGRSYFPGMLSQTEVSETGLVTPARVAAIQTGIDGFFEDLEPVNQVILQRDEPGQTTPPISPPPVVQERTVGLRPATQRRRLRR